MTHPAGNPLAEARARRAAELGRMTKAQLCRMYRQGVTAPDGGIQRYLGGMYPPEQWRKDEVIASILDIEHPPPHALGVS